MKKISVLAVCMDCKLVFDGSDTLNDDCPECSEGNITLVSARHLIKLVRNEEEADLPQHLG